METEISDACKGSIVVTHLQHVSLYLMVVPPPPKNIWEVQERVMNNLMFEKPVDEEDIKDLENWLKSCAEIALEVMNNGGETSLRTDSKEFEACFHYYFTLLLVYLRHTSVETDKAKIIHNMFVVQMCLRTIHEFTESILKTVVASGFKVLSPE